METGTFDFAVIFASLISAILTAIFGANGIGGFLSSLFAGVPL